MDTLETVSTKMQQIAINVERMPHATYMCDILKQRARDGVLVVTWA